MIIFHQELKMLFLSVRKKHLRLGHDYIGTEHLMLGILRDGEGKAISILNAIEVDLDNLRRKVEILNPALLDHNGLENSKKNLHLTRQAERALKTTFLEAKLFQSDLINTAHLLLCILRNENDPTTKLLENLNINYDSVKEQFKLLLTSDNDYSDFSLRLLFQTKKKKMLMMEKRILLPLLQNPTKERNPKLQF